MHIGGALAALAAIWIGTAAAAAVDGDPICADRPGAATPACTVPAGMVQIESTFAGWAKDTSGGVRSHSLSVGDTAVKFGLTDRLHVEVQVAPYVRESAREGGVRETLSGFGDMGLAAKYRLTADDAPVQLALYPYLKIPTARRPLGNGKAEGGLIVPIEYGIPRTVLTLGLSPQIELVADEDARGHHAAMTQVAGLGASLTDRLSASAELWASWDWDPAGTVRQYGLAGSAALLLSNDVQVDAGFGIGLNRAAPDLELYSGIAFRF